jgi:hypothetical protein
MTKVWKSPLPWIFLLTGFLLYLFGGMFMLFGKSIVIWSVTIMDTNFVGSCFTMGCRAERAVVFVVSRIIFPFVSIIFVGVSSFFIFAATANRWFGGILLSCLYAAFGLFMAGYFLLNIPVVEDWSE